MQHIHVNTRREFMKCEYRKKKCSNRQMPNGKPKTMTLNRLGDFGATKTATVKHFYLCLAFYRMQERMQKRRI